ncbi:hypothetical protein Suden_0629 [Sulfurimonas denitrificans DSM 1251]|jgi:hypothetical protein|uniref:Uncharacterized protein n=1 Tax=Sulfurimonas denitrificans (strain ATCC 33889 / DSM 1251) TaxID=326298 RepID=Q30SX3_SULDN|nr:hypothetical protein [Sulfurimonas denitrificans]ABB43908.1 hypothetical protein Suden_0629 [Sulfurimonas denitrificans DSM 1251]MDD3442383.1 hypothetical protein [Sulfurimonas denitrificans]
MKIQNPFEDGHIKNYILLYASVVVIMILFFIATTLFHDISNVDKKIFSEDKNTLHVDKRETNIEQNSSEKRFRLLERSY